MFNSSSNKSTETTISHKDNNNNKYINQIYKESTSIYDLITNSNSKIFLIKYNELISIYQNNDDAQNNEEERNNIYFLISKNWIENFFNFCRSKEPYNLPGKIDNNGLIINDNSALKLKNDTNIYMNNNCSCEFIQKDIWKKLLKLFGGGPEYKIWHYNKKYLNFIKEGGHVNLLFIPGKINKNNFIHEYTYFDLHKSVKDLMNHINILLNSNKSKFSIKEKEILEENKHYRLWLLIAERSEILQNYISIQMTRKNNNLDKNNKNDYYFSLKDINENENFKVYPLSDFEKNKIKDIFPNESTKYFEYRQYTKLKKKDGYSLPLFTIIIEKNPFKFKTNNFRYKMGTCKQCDYEEIVYFACKCNKLFFCCENCENNYKKKSGVHYKNCKIFLENYFDEENNIFQKKNNNKLIYPLIGLYNLGNTCYMNSALQCMRSIKELTRYFQNFFDKSKLNINNAIGTGSFLTMAYKNFLNNMNYCDKKYYSPKYFKYAIGLIDERYSDYDQQDTCEFMTFLIDSIHEDLNKVINKPIIQRKDSEIDNNNSNNELENLKSVIEWNNFLKRNQSIMVDLFYGQYKTTISCTKCKNKCINFSIYLSLQLPISKEFFIIKVFFSEEGLSKNTIKISVILHVNSRKIFQVKSLIGKILGISPYQIEIVKYQKNQINYVFEDDEEIPENIKIITAIKINLISFDKNNIYSKNNINYEKINENIILKEKKLINTFKNVNDNNEEDEEKNKDFKNNKKDNALIYENHYFEKFIIKHYCNSEDNHNIINKDNLIYLETSKSCFNLYFKIYLIYYLIILKNYIQSTNTNYNTQELYRIFNVLFKDLIDKENISLDNCKDDIPFILELGESKKEKIFIPPMRYLNFKEFLERNKNIENNNKNNKSNKKDENEDEFEISNLCDKDDKEENNGDGDLLVNTEAFPNSNNQQSKVNNNNNVANNENTKSKNEKNEKSILINISNGDKTKNSENKEINSKYDIKTIKIIWNTRFLIKSDSNNNYYLSNKQDNNTIDLWPFFQKMYDNYFGKISIDKCFEEFTKEEEFDADNLWKCSKCHNSIPAKNKIEIYQTPKILIIQLKRFKNDEKIKTFVEFPLTNLDISRFVSHNKSKYNGLNKKYDLFAVANHYGELEYGHYDAYCLNYIDNHWYNFDDKDVHFIDKKYEKDTIITKNAYVLFYREQNNDLIDWEKIYNKNFVEINDNNLKSYEEDFIYKYNKNRNREEGIFDIFRELDNKVSSKENKNNNNDNNNKGIENNEEEKESENYDDISLGVFVYNPFKESYLRLKRNRSKSDIMYKNDKVSIY